MAGFAFYPVFNLVNLALLGKQDDKDLMEAYGLATMAVSLTLEAFCISMTTCLETLVSQAYGARDF